MKDMESQFLEHSKTIRITPHARTWERVEVKLQAHRSRRKLISARLLNIAAAVTLLVVVSISVFLYTQNQHLRNAKAYSMSIEELSTSGFDSESIYDIVRIRRVYAEYQ